MSAVHPKQKDLNFSLADGLFYSLMVGAGEIYIPAFALAIGINQVTAGLLATIPLVGGGVLQLITPYGILYFGSNKKWVLFCALLQAICFIPLWIGAYLQNISTILLFVLATLYWGCGLAGGSAWNSWMEDLIPKRVRTNFLTKRNRLMQFIILLGFVASGHLLWNAKQKGFELEAFGFLFLIAFIARILSSLFLFFQKESFHAASFKQMEFKEIISRFKGNDAGRFLTFMVCMQLCVHMAAPYFTPYMIVQMKLNYLDYITLISASYIGRIVTLPLLGKLSHKIGAYKLLWMSAFFIAPLSGAWVISSNLIYLIVLQLLSGAVWAGFELAGLVLIFEKIRANERQSILSWYNFGHTLFVAFGSIFGGIVLEFFSESRQGFHFIFILSSILRLTPMLILFKVAPSSLSLKSIQLRTLGLRAAIGAYMQPIFSSGTESQSNRDEDDG